MSSKDIPTLRTQEVPREAEMYLPTFISKIIYALLLSPLQPRTASSLQFKAALFDERSSYGFTTAVVHLVDRMVPGTAQKLSRWLHDNERFPWSPVDFELIAYGSGTAIFKVDWQGGSKVLRIYRRSLGKPVDKLLEVAAYYKKNYEKVRSWYGDLVLPMEFLILRAPWLVGPVAASLQPYIGGQKLDLFEDFSEEEVLALFKKNVLVRQQFIQFARQTLSVWNEGELCFDLLGRQNLMLINRGVHSRLCIPDCGIFKLDVLTSRHPSKIAHIERRINRLAFLYTLAQKTTDVVNNG